MLPEGKKYILESCGLDICSKFCTNATECLFQTMGFLSWKPKQRQTVVLSSPQVEALAAIQEKLLAIWRLNTSGQIMVCIECMCLLNDCSSKFSKLLLNVVVHH